MRQVQTESMDLPAALSFAGSHRRSVLTTIRRDGRPQLSNVLHTVGDDGVLRISVTAQRAKTKNLRHRPWAALHVTSEDFWSYTVIEGDVELSPVATSPDDPTVEELVSYYRSVAGEHGDWEAYRRAMVADQRLVARLRPARAYGQLAAAGS